MRCRIEQKSEQINTTTPLFLLVKIGIISDVHANSIALEEVLKELKTKNVDKIVCAGDLVGYNPFPNEVMEIMKNTEILTINGNHDRAVLTGDTSWFNQPAAEAIVWTRKALTHKNIEYLKTLERRKTIDIGGLKIAIIHGSPYDDDEYVYPDMVTPKYLQDTNADILILGHSHQQWYMDFSRGTYADVAQKDVPIGNIIVTTFWPDNLKKQKGLVINPGAVGQPRDYDWRAAYAVLEILEDAGDKNSTETHYKHYKLSDVPVKLFTGRVEYDVEAVISEIERKGLPGFLGERLREGV